MKSYFENLPTACPRPTCPPPGGPRWTYLADWVEALTDGNSDDPAPSLGQRAEARA